MCIYSYALSIRLSQRSQDVRVTSVQNGNDTDSEQLTDGSTQLVVTTLEVVHSGLGQHGVVLQLRLSQDWGVGGNDDQLGLALSQSLDSGLVTKGVFTGLDHQSQLLVDRFLGFNWGLYETVSKRKFMNNKSLESIDTDSSERNRLSASLAIPYLKYTDHLCVYVLNTPVLLG